MNKTPNQSSINQSKEEDSSSPKYAKPKRFEIQKDTNLSFNPTTNYYQEYWKMFYDNEYLLAQIKENAYEINAMKVHIDELNKKIN